ncbi:MAG: carboxypeptidase regulatory-like domain-containing protein [Verrucomicrobia bacterium]|nr:carboxypeptidase regulatory-like domain-containing protein [Verrucomicrobiota bacterium]
MKRNLLVIGGIAALAIVVLLTVAPWRTRPSHDETSGTAGRTGRTRQPGRQTPDGASTSNGGDPGSGEDGERLPVGPDGSSHRLPAGTVAGRVVDQDSQPVEKAQVVVLMARHTKAYDEKGEPTTVKHQDLFARVIETDSRGRFEISGIPAEAVVPLEKSEGLDESVTCSLLAQKDGYRMARQDVVPGAYAVQLVLEETAAVVSGRVIARDTGKPLAGSRILCRPGETETKTDADGAFRLKVPVSFEPPDSIAVSVICYPTAPEYAPQELADVRVMQGQEVGDLLFELEHGSLVLRGEVLDGQTQARVPGMRVRLYERDPYQYYYFPDGSRPELTADAADGTFEFTGLRPGIFQIEAVRTDWNCTLARYQETLEEGGGPKDVKIFVNTTGSRIITGTVTGPSGEPLQNAAVWLIQRVQPRPSAADEADTPPPPSMSLFTYQPAATDAEGRYGFQLYFNSTQQKVGAVALYPGCELTYGWLDQSDQSVYELDLALHKGARVAGTVTDEAGTPLEKVSVVIDGEALGPAFLASSPSLPNPRAAVTTGPDGTYEFDTLPAGDYIVAAEHTDYAFRQTDVTVARSADSRLDIALERGQTIRGTVYDEQGQPLSIRSVVAVNSRWREYDATPTNPDGRFTLRRIPSGEPVTVLVLEDRVDLRTAKTFHRAAVEHVSPGAGDLTIVAERMQFGAVEVEVVDAKTGDPVPSFEVWSARQPQPGLKGLARTFYYRPDYGRTSVKDGATTDTGASGGEAGRVTLMDLLPGPHDFYVNADGYNAKVSGTVRIEGGGTSKVRVELERTVGSTLRRLSPDAP